MVFAFTPKTPTITEHIIIAISEAGIFLRNFGENIKITSARIPIRKADILNVALFNTTAKEWR